VSDWATREDYWSDLAESDDDQDDGDDVETETVRERLTDELDAEQLHGLAVTRRQGETIYAVVSRSTTWDAVDDSVDMDIPVLDVRTVAIDLDDDAVRVSDNGIWVPRESDVSESLTALLARASTDLNKGLDPETNLTLKSAVDGLDAGDVLDREIEVEADHVDGQDVDKMERHTGIDPSRSWGYGGGPPPEIVDAVKRLRKAGLDESDHLHRLVWGKKEPLDRTMRPVEEMVGNYGIELQPRESGLIAIDVDYPEHFPESELPETWEVSSPHGDDERRHIIFRCEEKDKIAEELGAWAVQRVDWGDLWIGNRYVVGPGCQLSEFGCDADGYTRDEPGGCETCEDHERGYYRVVSDNPIATVSADRVLALLEESDYVPRNGPADPDPPEADDRDDDETDATTCDSCGAVRKPDNLKNLDFGDSEGKICRGGCDE